MSEKLVRTHHNLLSHQPLISAYTLRYKRIVMATKSGDEHVYDVCVIGAGVNGSAAAYSLSTSHTSNVLLLEQFPVPHTRGSSHGQSRIIRCSYSDLIYSQMTFDAFDAWKDLEEKYGERLLIQNGMLDIFVDDSETIKKYVSNLSCVGAPCAVLDAAEVNRRFPLFRIPMTCRAIYEPGGGTLLASKCVSALHRLFVSNGGTFVDSESVMKIDPGEVVTIHTSKSRYMAKSVIIAAGAYTSKLSTQLGLRLPLEVQRTHPLYWRLDDPVAASVDSNFPSFISRLTGEVYGLATYEYPEHIKICRHAGPVIDPEHPDVVAPLLGEVKEFIEKYTNGIESSDPSIVETCMYTVTPDGNFIIDTHPIYKNIVLAAGFSGHGFKMSMTTGKILADLALGRTPGYDLSMFQIGRFGDAVREQSKL